MGSYLHAGIIHKFCFSVSKSSPKGVSLDEFNICVAKTVVGNLDCFTCEAQGDFFRWYWKGEARKKYLTPLLERYYEDFYGKGSKNFVNYCQPALDFLNQDIADEDFHRRVNEADLSCFYYLTGWDRYPIVNGLSIKVIASFYSLSCEGKVKAEELDEHLNFFEKNMRIAYGDNPLGTCLTVGLG